MPTGLILPERRLPAPEPPERIALNMAFGAGNPAILGDKSRYNSHGAITTATVAAGLHGLCLSFNPANPDSVVIPAAHTQLDFTSEDFSIVWRGYIDDLTADRMMIVRGSLNVDGWEVKFRGGGGLDFFTYQLAAFQRSRVPIGTFAVNTWYTVGISRTGNSGRIYRNGVDITATVGVHINPLTSASNAYIGITGGIPLDWFDGRMEFLRIFRGVALQASEHLAWHNALA